MNDVIIIGGGPAGLMAAIAAGRSGAKTLLLEKNNIIGKKLRLTGNGKCNYSNLNINGENREFVSRYYNIDENSNCADIMCKYDSAFFETFFKENMIFTHEKDKLLYPYSENATVFTESLIRLAVEENVKILPNETVANVLKKDDMFQVLTENKKLYTAQNLIVATGGKAYPKTGSDGGGIKLLRALGHTTTYTYPGLVRLRYSDKHKSLKSCSGVRIKCNVKALVDGRLLMSESGELQITDEYLSGICIFNLSRVLSRPIEEQRDCKIQIDFVPDISEDELKGYLLNCEDCDKRRVFAVNLLGNKLAEYILNNSESDSLEAAFKKMTIDITGHGSFNDSQITIGGVVREELDGVCQSLICPGLYVIGEAVDVDAACGGYNIHWALSSGYAAGNDILNKK